MSILAGALTSLLSSSFAPTGVGWCGSFNSKQSVRADRFLLNAGQHEASETSFDTKRLPLGKIFNEGRDYLFATQTNIRDFEWKEKHAEDLFESFASLLVGEDADDLELNTIVLMKQPPLADKEKRRNLGKTSEMYNVHDGQQRLVSLSLFLAALRDNFAEWPDCEEEEQDVAQRIFPHKRGKDPITRIELREKNGKYLKCILSKKDFDGNSVSNTMKDILPTKKAQKNYPESDQRIFEVYRYLHGRIKELGPEQATELVDLFEGNAFLVIVVPTDTRSARNMVMGQNKGKNIEPVDAFKGMVCFNSIDGENDQDAALEKWNELCLEVGRKTVQDACILVARSWRGKSLITNGEVDYMENFLKEYLRVGQRRDGRTFFENIVLPGSKALKRFRDGHTSLSGSTGEELPSLFFLEAVSRLPIAKEIGIVVLEFLVMLETTTEKSRKVYIETCLRKLEAIALWMMLTKPNPATRLARCMEIIVASKQGNEIDLEQALSLTAVEKTQIIDIMNAKDFTKGEIPKAKAILGRINEFIQVTKHQQQASRPMGSKLHLEHIFPQKHSTVPGWTDLWDKPDAEKWLHRLGNLALLNEKVNAKIGNGPFEKKRDFLGESPYALTSQVRKEDNWDVDAVQRQHNTILDYAAQVWDLH